MVAWGEDRGSVGGRVEGAWEGRRVEGAWEEGRGSVGRRVEGAWEGG